MINGNACIGKRINSTELLKNSHVYNSFVFSNGVPLCYNEDIFGIIEIIEEEGIFEKGNLSICY